MRIALHSVCTATLLTTTILATPLASLANTPTSLDTVTVVATKNPQSTFDIPGMAHVIDVDSAEHAGSSNIKNILEDIPGLEFSGSARRNGQDITLRGYDTEGIVVLFDGVRQKFEAAHDGKFFIDPALLKRVEVIKGPNSTLYGSGGLGGVVSFTTKDAADFLAPGKNKGVSISSGYQSVNDEWMTSLSGYARSNQFDVVGNLLTRNSGDIELGDGNTLDSEDQVISGLFKLGWSLTDEQNLKFSVQGYNNDATEPNNPQSNVSDSGNDSLVDKNTSSYTTQLAYSYDNPDNDLVKFTARAYYTDTEVEEDILVATGTNAVGDTISRQLDTIGFTAENVSTFNPTNNLSHTITYGGEIYSEEQNGSDSANGEVGGIPDAEADFYGVFLQDEIVWNPEFGGKFLVIPGLRYDHYESNNTSGTSLDEKELSPKFGITYKPQDWFMAFGNYARAFRAPTMTEIFTTGTHFTIPSSGTNNFIANPDLRPETSDTIEYGFGLQFKDVYKNNDHFSLKASRFEIESEDFIDTEVNVTFFPSCCGTTQSVNVDQASLWGNDVEANYENDRIKLGFGYAYLTGKNDANGEFLTNIHPSTYTTHIAFKAPKYDAIAGVKSTFADKHEKVNSTSEIRDGYDVHDLYLQWAPESYENLTVNLGLDNVFDENYSRVFAGSAEPGRNFKVQVSYTW